ncbi:DNA-binding transcriptional LysR family regulator [Kibdelosporangium banguiense]|uniref:DNA-binding transcriptional LysR family regulator n=1 Tax=Kibdelosporangium banguiense TaxID=1365924 RepID=A0ABS4U2K0_9PSEU|nr:LysR family transcriptional regulator [Kibdelosporangium banguiense]MBP2330444.1 DNA-binding transcriptional LysR family regulator [Kibdelosporangium banguiense]
MDLEIRHLRVVNAIAEAGSISKAAAALGHTQPALTAQLQRIERALGGRLFVRDGSGAQPTALGTVVLSHSLSILSTHEELMRAVRQNDTDSATLRLGSVPGPLTAVMMTAARGLFPRAETSLLVNESEEELIELLVDGRLEVGLGLDYPGYELALPTELTEAVIAIEPIFVLLSAEHRLAGLPEIPLNALAEEVWLAGEGKDIRMRAQFRAACRRAGFTPRAVQRINASVTFPLIGQGHGVALAHALTPERANVVIRPLTDDPMWVRQRLIWPTQSPVASQAPQLRDALTEAYQTETAKSPAYSAWLRRRGRV